MIKQLQSNDEVLPNTVYTVVLTGWFFSTEATQAAAIRAFEGTVFTVSEWQKPLFGLPRLVGKTKDFYEGFTAPGGRNLTLMEFKNFIEIRLAQLGFWKATVDIIWQGKTEIGAFGLSTDITSPVKTVVVVGIIILGLLVILQVTRTVRAVV